MKKKLYNVDDWLNDDDGRSKNILYMHISRMLLHTRDLVLFSTITLRVCHPQHIFNFLYFFYIYKFF